MALWPQGVDLIELDEVDSTMDEARRLACSGAPGPVWVLAGKQNGGRGRQGRPWRNAAGNMYATFLCRPNFSPQTAAQTSFVACLAVASFFEGQGGSVALKWPNDALLNDRKAAGVLLEAGGGASGDWLSIGIGVNLAEAPEADPGAAHAPTSLLAETGCRVAPKEALTEIAASVEVWMAQLSTFGFNPIRDAWLSRAAKLGERITARTPRETITGVFEDVDLEGALVLRTPVGSRRLHAADIYFA